MSENPYKDVPRLRECCRQVKAEEVSNSRNNIHQTWERPYRDSLYRPEINEKCQDKFDKFDQFEQGIRPRSIALRAFAREHLFELGYNFENDSSTSL